MSQSIIIPNVSKNLIKRLNEREIRYCHWKSNEHLIAGLQGNTDIDILVDREHKNQFTSVLLQFNFKKLVSLITFSGVEDWLGFCPDTGVLLHLHVHFNLVTGRKYVKEIIFPWHAMALDTVIADDITGMKVINPNIEIIFLMMRFSIKLKYTTLFKLWIKRTLPYPQDFQSELDFLRERVSQSQVNHYLAQMFNGKNEIIVVLRKLIFVKSVSLEDILFLKKQLNVDMKHQKQYSNLKVEYLYFKRYLQAAFLKISEVLGYKVRRKKRFEAGGLLVVIIGSDGAGKSTMIKKIETWLGWKVNVIKYYFGSGDNIENSVLRYFQTCIKSTNSKINKVGKKSIKKSSVISILKLCVKTFYFMYMAKDKYENLEKSMKFNLAGEFVIGDRFPQMQFWGQNDSPNIKEHVVKYNSKKFFKIWAAKEERLYSSMLEINPDIIIKLIVSPEIAYQRKPDHNLDQLKRKAEIMEKLQFNNSKVYSINADKSIVEVELMIRRIIWENL